MKRVTYVMLGVVLLTMIGFPFALPGHAQDPEGVPTWEVEPVAPVRPTGTPPAEGTGEIVPLIEQQVVFTPQPLDNPDDQTLFSLGQLGFATRNLLGPADAVEYSFRLPNYWQLTTGVELQLDLSTLVADINGVSPNPENLVLDGDIALSFNGVWLMTIPVQQILGARTIVIPLPVEAVQAVAPGGVHVLSLWLDARYECLPGADWHTTVTVENSSRLYLPHLLLLPSTNLSRLPLPIYGGSSFPERALVIVPDAPTAEQLRAAYVIAAAFGHQTSGNLSMTLIPVAQLTPALRDNNHLVFIGGPEAFPELGPASLFQPSATEERGMIQMAISPWNAARVLLVLSGNSDAALVNAAQSLAVGPDPQPGQPNLAFASQIMVPDHVIAQSTIDQTFEEMGQTALSLNRVGTSVAEARFDVPYGMRAQDGGYLDLAYSFSVPVTYMSSGVTVRLNGQPLNSFSFDSATGTQRVVRISIPPSAIKTGQNVLSFYVYLAPAEATYCVAEPAASSSSVTILPQSRLFLPLAQATVPIGTMLDLADYPQPFLGNGPMLSGAAFVLPAGAAGAWNDAFQLAFNMGELGGVEPAEVMVAFADATSTSLNGMAQHLIVVGQPRQLPVLDLLGDALPARIAMDTQLIAPQNDLTVDYLLPEGVDAGYLELMPSPWNDQGAVLAVLGNSDNGVSLAATSLVSTTLRSRLSGNVALLSEGQLVTSRLE